MDQDLCELIERLGLMRYELLDVMKYLEYRETDIIGNVFGKLTVLSRKSRVKLSGYEYVWMPEYECVCGCGQEVLATHDDLLGGAETSCIDCEKV